jgi:hypothetical protein
VIPVASIAVISALIHAPLDMVFASALGLGSGPTISTFVSFFLSALICGYIFAGMISEARREAVSKITVLWAALVFLVLQFKPALANWGQMASEANQGQYGATLSTLEQVHWQIMYLNIFVFLFVLVAVVVGLIGLYVGSMSRKRTKLIERLT